MRALGASPSWPRLRAALASEKAQLPTMVDPMLLEGTTVNFSRSLVRLAWMLQHAETLLPMAGELQAELNSHSRRQRYPYVGTYATL